MNPTSPVRKLFACLSGLLIAMGCAHVEPVAILPNKDDAATRAIRTTVVQHILRDENDATIFLPPDLFELEEIKALGTEKLLLLPNNKDGYEGRFWPIRANEYSISFDRIASDDNLANVQITKSWKHITAVWSELTLQKVQNIWIVTAEHDIGVACCFPKSVP